MLALCTYLAASLESGLIMPGKHSTRDAFAEDVLVQLRQHSMWSMPKCRAKHSAGWWCSAYPRRDNDALANALPLADASTGLWLEFGVWTGRTIRLIASFRRAQCGERKCQPEATSNAVYGFDWFRGLPTYWTKYHPKGRFDTSGHVPFADGTDGVRWVVGLFNESLPAFLQQHRQPVTFVHIDCDLYVSAAVVLSELLRAGRLARGVVLTFDEVVNYPEYRDHEMQALYELFRESNRTLQVIGYAGGADLPSNPIRLRKGYTAAAFRLL